METIHGICQRIDLPSPMRQWVLQAHAQLDFDALGQELQLLFSRQTWDQGRAALLEKLGPDPDGRKILACMLHGACQSAAEYARLGLEQRVFDDSFRGFSRFVREHETSYGVQGFDRSWWTARLLALELFRLGELEYERLVQADGPVLSLHIPSDAALSAPRLRASYDRARAFFAAHFPDWAHAPCVCHTWLLDPVLRQLLPPDSNILAFQRNFTITRLDHGERDYLEWVFKDPNLPLEQLPEQTGLQRSMKRHLLSGGEICEALGILIPEPFVG